MGKRREYNLEVRSPRGGPERRDQIRKLVSAKGPGVWREYEAELRAKTVEELRQLAEAAGVAE